MKRAFAFWPLPNGISFMIISYLRCRIRRMGNLLHMLILSFVFFDICSYLDSTFVIILDGNEKLFIHHFQIDC